MRRKLSSHGNIVVPRACADLSLRHINGPMKLLPHLIPTPQLRNFRRSLAVSTSSKLDFGESYTLFELTSLRTEGVNMLYLNLISQNSQSRVSEEPIDGTWTDLWGNGLHISLTTKNPKKWMRTYESVSHSLRYATNQYWQRFRTCAPWGQPDNKNGHLLVSHFLKTNCETSQSPLQPHRRSSFMDARLPSWCAVLKSLRRRSKSSTISTVLVCNAVSRLPLSPSSPRLRIHQVIVHVYYLQ